jgi:hypothetical protein
MNINMWGRYLTMKSKTMLATALFTVLMLNVSAEGPLKITGQVNGVDPTTTIATVNPGETAYVRLYVEAPSEGGVVTNVVFASYPGALAGVLNNLVEKRGKLPYQLRQETRVENVDVPGFTPAGLYDVTGRVYYTHGFRSYSNTYKFKINVKSGGVISSILGVVVRFAPDIVTRKLIDFGFALLG